MPALRRALVLRKPTRPVPLLCPMSQRSCHESCQSPPGSLERACSCSQHLHLSPRHSHCSPGRWCLLRPSASVSTLQALLRTAAEGPSEPGSVTLLNLSHCSQDTGATFKTLPAFRSAPYRTPAVLEQSSSPLLTC